MNKETLRTSVQWLEKVSPKTVILDPDGWNRSRYRYSFHEELISEEEFTVRLGNSTTMQIGDV